MRDGLRLRFPTEADYRTQSFAAAAIVRKLYILNKLLVTA